MATWYVENWAEPVLLERLQLDPQPFIDEINFHDPRGYTALHVAAKKGATALTQRLLELGAKVDDRDRTRHTPLHFAAATGHTTVVNVLLHHGADVNARSADGSTPLHYAALYGFEQIVLDLLQRGADPFAINDSKSTPLHYASSSGHAAIMRILVTHGEGAGRRSLALRDVTGATALAYFPIAEVSPAVMRERLVSHSGSALSRDWAQLLQSGELHDVELHFQDATLTAHRLVLRARAPELLERLVLTLPVSTPPPSSEAALQGASSRLELRDVSASAGRALLQWLYTNEISQLDMRWDAFRGLVELALRLELKHFLSWLEIVMERNLDPVSLPHLANYMVTHAAHFPALVRAMARLVVVAADVVFLDDAHALAFSSAALALLLGALTPRAFDRPVAPLLAPFPAGYTPPTFLDEPPNPARAAYSVAPLVAPQQSFSDAEKEQLLASLTALSDHDQCMEEVGSVVSDPRYASTAGSDEIDLNSLPVAALIELRNIVRKYERR